MATAGRKCQSCRKSEPEVSFRATAKRCARTCRECQGDFDINRVCRSCNISKPVAEFKWVDAKHERRTRLCKLCHFSGKKAWEQSHPEMATATKRREHARNRDRYLEYSRSDTNKHRVFEWKLRNVYGIDMRQFLELDKSQGYCCAICNVPWSSIGCEKFRRPHIDHCHETGVVRGLLCHHCNAAIGHLKDDPEIVVRAAIYLENAKAKHGDR